MFVASSGAATALVQPTTAYAGGHSQQRSNLSTAAVGSAAAAVAHQLAASTARSTWSSCTKERLAFSTITAAIAIPSRGAPLAQDEAKKVR